LGLIRDWVYGYPEEIMSNSEFMEKLKEFVQASPSIALTHLCLYLCTVMCNARAHTHDT
jgi:hypothetical protein